MFPVYKLPTHDVLSQQSEQTKTPSIGSDIWMGMQALVTPGREQEDIIHL